MNSRTVHNPHRVFGAVGILIVALACLLMGTPVAIAGPPTHLRTPDLDLVGAAPDPGPTHPAAPFNQACGTAVDSRGDVYVASAGNDVIDVFNAAHEYLTSIANTNEPCGLAVDSTGKLYVSEKAVGKVVRYTPNAYPFAGTPTYGAPTTIDSSGDAKGISVDPFDDRLYVARGDHIAAYNPDGSFGINEVQRVLSFSATGGGYRLAMPGEGSATRNETQRISRDYQVNGGTFTLSFNGQTTTPIAYNAPAQGAGSVEEALVALSNIAPGDVAVRGIPAQFSDQNWWVEFTGSLANTDVPLLEGDGAGLSGSGNWSNEIVVEALSEITAPLAYDATHAQVQAALEALSTIGAGNVVVTQGPNPTPYDHLVSFTGGLAATDVAPIAGDASELIGGGGQTVLVYPDYIKAFDGLIGDGGDLTNATGVAAYTFPSGDRYVFAADDATTDVVKIFSGTDVRNLKPRATVDGAGTPDGSFGFGAAGAHLAVDPGNREAGGDGCASVDEQACTAGHLLVYDAGHAALDEFDATGEYLDQMSGPELADAEPSGIAVERSGGPGDGTIYLGVGAGAGSKVLAFGPLVQPGRATLDEPLSHLLEGARAVATDDRGDVYVVAGSFVHVYGPLGNKLTSFEDPHPLLNGLTVDSEGNVYVLEEQNAAVHYYEPSQYPPQEGTTYTRHEPAVAESADFPSGSRSLRAIAVDPGPGAGRDRLFVASYNIVRIYKPAREGSGVLTPEFAPGLPLPGTTGTRAVQGASSIAVEGASARNGGQTTVYIGANPQRISAINAAGTEVLARINGAGCAAGAFPFNPNLAVDQANGHVLVFDSSPETTAFEFDGSGACVAQFGHFTDLQRHTGIAVDSSCALHVDPETGEEEPLDEATTPTCAEYDPADGNAYVAFDDTSPEHPPYDVTAFGPLSYGEPPRAKTGTPSEVGGGEATLNGRLDPRGFEVEACDFEYLAEDEYKANVEAEEPPFAGAASVACAESAAEIGRGEEPVPVHAAVSLDTEAHNCVRLVATNKYGTGEGEAICFGPPRVEAQPAHPIHYTEATVRAVVDPAGLLTDYRCEYGKAAGAYDRATPMQALAADAGASDVRCVLTDLAEGTAYHVRVVAENEAGAAAGVDQEVVTLVRRAAESCPNAEYRTGLSANLPDCRAYELVTPAETNGLSPRAVTGSSDRGFNQWLTPPRGASAGQSLSYVTPGTLPGFEGNGAIDGYRAARAAGEHPVAGWQSSLFGPTYAQAAPNILRTTLLMQGISPDQSYSIWQVELAESFSELAAGGTYLRTPAGFEALGRGELGEDPGAVGRYLSAGGAHVIFSSSAHLESDAPPAGTEALYDRAAAAAHAEVLSLDPEGSPFGGDARYLGANEAGTAVVFSVGGTLYERREGATVEVAAAPATFAGVSEDGRYVFYAAGANGEAAAALYVCEVEDGSCAGPGAHAPVQIAAAGIFANVSTDGSHAFFSSKDVLTGSDENDNGETAQPDARNLYAWDGSNTRFIARLSDADFQFSAFASGMNLGAWARAVGGPGPATGRAYAPTRSTSSGSVLAFQSHARLTAYDNEGVGEIYRYDPAAPAGERLTCPSCDPSGAPPGADALFQDIEGNTATNSQIMIPNLTDDGAALVFSSPDPLLPEDANSVVDVYEWRARGSQWGSATGAPSCERAGGCLALISSGQGERDNYLYSMSADGRDVFFRTYERLVGADVAGSASIYDAREGGGIPEPASQAPCQGDACQGQDSIPPALPSPTSTGSGDGNVQEGTPKSRCVKGKRKVRRNGKTRCVKKHSKKRRDNKRRRANHSRRAGR